MVFTRLMILMKGKLMMEHWNTLPEMLIQELIPEEEILKLLATILFTGLLDLCLGWENLTTQRRLKPAKLPIWRILSGF